jgi:hypothetical protein
MKPHATLSLVCGLLVLLAAGFPARARAATDLDRDAKADLVWRHARTGDLGVWLMDGVTLRQAAVVERVGDPGWRFVGAGDVDADGRGDLVWHHTPTGQVGVWLMDGATLRQAVVVDTVADLRWQIVAVGDTNGDRRADVVWQNTATSEIAVWLMAGAAVGQAGGVGHSTDLGWRVAGVGDADGDGKADLFRRHALTGEVEVWLLDGFAVRQTAVIAPPADPDWRIVGIGDVDGDGKADVIRHNAVSGAVSVWLVDGLVVRQSGTVTTVADLAWQVVDVGDVDGDDKADLVWFHTSTGQAGVWLMDGIALRQARVVVTVTDLAWTVQPERAIRPTLLNPGEPRGRTLSVGESHLFEFWVNAPTRVVAQATRRAGGLNPCVEVYTGTPATLVAGGSHCAVDHVGKFARLNVILPAGIYQLAVRDAGDNDEGGYNVLMLAVAAEFSAPLDADFPLPGLVDRLGDINLYQFTLEAPTRVVIEATRSAPPRINPCLEVYSGAPAQLVAGGTDCAENTTDGRVGHLDLALAPGTYFVAVHDAGQDDKGNYTLLLLPLTETTSPTLSVGVPQSATISKFGDVNLHRFDLDVATRVVLQVSRTSGGTHGINPCLEAYSGDPAQPVAGSAICATNTAEGRAVRRDLTLPAGTHFATVRDAGGDEDGDYSVLMLPVTAAASTSLAMGIAQRAAIGGVGEIDLYRFTLDTPAHVQVRVTRAGKESRVNPCLEVYAGAPAELVPGGQVCASTAFSGKVATLNLSLASGTYVVIVHDAAGDDVGDYDVQAVVVP